MKNETVNTVLIVGLAGVAGVFLFQALQPVQTNKYTGPFPTLPISPAPADPSYTPDKLGADRFCAMYPALCGSGGGGGGGTNPSPIPAASPDVSLWPGTFQGKNILL